MLILSILGNKNQNAEMATKRYSLPFGLLDALLVAFISCILQFL